MFNCVVALLEWNDGNYYPFDLINQDYAVKIKCVEQPCKLLASCHFLSVVLLEDNNLQVFGSRDLLHSYSSNNGFTFKSDLPMIQNDDLTLTKIGIKFYSDTTKIIVWAGGRFQIHRWEYNNEFWNHEKLELDFPVHKITDFSGDHYLLSDGYIFANGRKEKTGEYQTIISNVKDFSCGYSPYYYSIRDNAKISEWCLYILLYCGDIKIVGPSEFSEHCDKLKNMNIIKFGSKIYFHEHVYGIINDGKIINLASLDIIEIPNRKIDDVCHLTFCPRKLFKYHQYISTTLQELYSYDDDKNFKRVCYSDDNGKTLIPAIVKLSNSPYHKIKSTIQ